MPAHVRNPLSILALSFRLIAIFVVSIAAVTVGPEADAQTQTAVDLALYNSEQGSWQQEVESLRTFLIAAGYTFEEVNPAKVNAGALESGSYRALLVPGGLVGILARELTPEGAEKIRRFIDRGGGYLGICAGAGLASSQFSAALESKPPGETHKPHEYLNWRYRSLLGIWPGEARAPYPWAPFQNGPSFENVSITSQAPIVHTADAQNSRMYYHAGPMLSIDVSDGGARLSGFEIWGLLQPPPGIEVEPERRASIVKFGFGKGNVVLFAQHPIIPFLNGAPVDMNTRLGDFDRAMTEGADSENNWRNWNLLNASIQAVLNRPVQALSKPETIRALSRTHAKQCEAGFIQTP